MDEHRLLPPLDEVLEEYAMTVGTPDHTVLLDWLGRYPEYAQELIDFTVSWSRMHWFPQLALAEVEDAADDGPWLERSRAVVRDLLKRQRAQVAPAPTSPLTDLFTEAQKWGLSRPQFAAATRLSLSLLAKLDRRLIRYASIPHVLIETLAKVLQRDAASVSAYLHSGPQYVAGAHYLAQEAPQLPEPEDFLSAIKSDRLLSPEDRQYWLSQARYKE